MSDTCAFTIDGKHCTAKKGQTIVQAARDNGVYIPVLCYYEGIKPAGTCRICTVLVNDRPMAACTTPVANNMNVANDTPGLNEMRKCIIEMLFVEGNHFCPSCEKSGQCDLQALAYRYRMLAPRFSYEFARCDIDATPPNLLLERNRCIVCKRCVNGIRNPSDKSLFGLSGRGCAVRIDVDGTLSREITGDIAQKAMDICPVGAIIRKENGFMVPIGKRKYDKEPIGGVASPAAAPEGTVHG